MPPSVKIAVITSSNFVVFHKWLFIRISKYSGFRMSGVTPNKKKPMRISCIEENLSNQGVFLLIINTFIIIVTIY